MKAEIAQKWVAALRSGEFKQGHGRLRMETAEAFCCLGVLCELHRIEHGGCWDEDGRYLLSGGSLPAAVRDWSGVGYSRGFISSVSTSLATVNDSGATFSEIATLIEQHAAAL